MCGIAGFAAPWQISDPLALLKDLAGPIAHRGPDDEGYFNATAGNGAFSIGIAHRRLAIIDLHSGHQPLGNEDGSIQIVFNGEIYNFRTLRDELIAKGHQFKTASDTETIVHAYEEYGERCLERFRGMFAFAIWDAAKQELFIARDRYGKKPLYLCEVDGGLLFASEIKSLLQTRKIGAVADHQAIWDYLAYRYVPGPRTLFQGIRKLPPGHCLTWSAGKISLRQWFSPDDCRQAGSQQSLGSDIAGDFLEALEESVAVRMVSDVPFGAFLSGGIDSSAIVGLMSRHSDYPVKTFSVGFRETEYSELAYARVIADTFRTDHHELTVSQDEMMEQLPAMVAFRDAPVAEPSDIPIYLLSVEARKTVKMVLTGEGSDEFLGGYPKHSFERFVRAYHWVPGLLRSGVIEPLIRALPYRFRRAKTAVETMGIDDWRQRMVRWFGALSNDERAALAAFQVPAGVSAEGGLKEPVSGSALRKILCFDQSSWLPDNLLERGDRMTMAASLEARMPFMDHELAAFISRLPDNYRIRGMTSKWILRQAMTRLLPAKILDRPKVGFRVPVNEWFRGPMREFLLDQLLGSDSRTLGLYHQDKLERLLKEHIDGRQNHEKLLWMLLNLEIWFRRYAVSA